jgi:N-acetylglucosamine malate deacetylase 1
MVNNWDSNAEVPVRVLILGAHPDDAEVSAGGLVVRHCHRGSEVRIISVTDGRSGHHQLAADELVRVRRQEARQAGERVGAEYHVWDFPDGALEPNLVVRSAIIREIRQFAPDLVLTHRPHDYHPDHRAVGIAVQDASYMVTVPHVCPETPALTKDPVVAYMGDLFTRPNPLRPDVLLDITEEFDLVVQMAACHASQFFEWLPYHDGLLEQVPRGVEARHEWLSEWLRGRCQLRREHFEAAIVERGGKLEEQMLIEVYEISEYARQLDAERLQILFPGSMSPGTIGTDE